MIIARITDSYSYGKILYTLHEDCVTEGTSSKILYRYGDGCIIEPLANCALGDKVVYRYDDHCVTDTNNKVVYYLNDDVILDEARRIVAYIKRDSNSEDDNSEKSRGEGGDGPSGTATLGGCLVYLLIYCIFIAIICSLFNVGFFKAFFGAPVLFCGIYIMQKIVDAFGG